MHAATLIIALILIVTIPTIAIIILAFKYRNNKGNRELQDMKQKLEFTLRAFGGTFWEYDVNSDKLWSETSQSSLKAGMSFNNYVNIHYNEDESVIRSSFAELCNGKRDRIELEIRLKGDDSSHTWIKIDGIVTKYNADGTAARIIGVKRTIQNEVTSRLEHISNKKQIEEYSIQSNLAMRAANLIVWNYNYITEIFSSLENTSYMYVGMSKEDFIESIHKDDRHIAIKGLKELHCGCESFNSMIRVEIPNKGFRYFDINATVLERDDNGNVIKITGMRRDITEEVELRNELIKLRDIAEESNKLKTAFLANMGHEIRTPLNAIVGFSNMIASTDDEELKQEYSKIIESNNDLLLQLVNDILDLSKIEAGKLEFNFDEANIDEMMYQLEQMFSLRATEGVKVIFETPNTNPQYLLTDQLRLTQVISNLLSNSLKFTKQGEIRLGYQTDKNGTYFYVTDTGKGIKPENLPFVFDRFAKFDPCVTGTGLGLSICKMIVGRLGGEIKVESKLDEGSKFYFTVANGLYSKPQLSFNQ